MRAIPILSMRVLPCTGDDGDDGDDDDDSN